MMTREALFEAFANGSKVILRNNKGSLVCGSISSIEREDGSGYSYNVYLYGATGFCYVRCPRPVHFPVTK